MASIPPVPRALDLTTANTTHMRQPTIACVCALLVTAWFGPAAPPSAASEVLLPDEAIQRVYRAVIRTPEPSPAHRQFVRDLKELAQLYQLTQERLRAKDDIEDHCHLIESKAEELKRDRRLLERFLAEWEATPQKGRRPSLVDPGAATKKALQRLSVLQETLDRLAAAAKPHDDAAPTASHGKLHRLLHEVLDQVGPAEPPAATAPLPPAQPTFGMYEPKPRAPRERGTVVPAYLQPGKPRALLNLAVPDAEAAGTGSPTAADLAPTLDAPITPEIQALVAQLGSAAAIYEYVRNGIEFESYYGSLKGALATLWSGRGNDVDQSSLLIALLRAAGIPCRYVQGTVQIPIQQAMDWLGVKDPEAARRILLAGNIPTVGVGDSSGQPLALKMEHTWVEAYVPYGYYRGIPQDATGARWIPLDPSVKVKAYQPSLQVFSSVPFDEDRYFAKRQRELPTDFFEEQLIQHLSESFPGRSLNDLGYTGAIAREQLEVLPSSLPYQYPVVAFLGEFAELPASLRTTVECELLTADEATSLLRTTFVLPEVSLKRITLSYPQSGSNLTPAIKVDGVTVATGPARPLGEGQHLKLRVAIPNVAPEDVPLRETLYPNIVAGEYYAIGLSGNQSSPALLERRINRMLANQATIGTPQEDPDEIKGEFLNISLLLYFRNLLAADARWDAYAQMRTIVSLPQIGVSRAKLNVETAFDLPFTISPDGLLIDVRRSFVSSNPIDGVAGTGRIPDAFHLRGLEASALEHEVWEELVKIESVSTVKGLQFAKETGIPVLTITPANLNEQLALLDSMPPECRISAGWRQTIVSRLSGSEPADSFTMPQEALFYNDWRGSVGMVIYRTAKVGEAYLIEGGLAGGGTTLLERVVSAVEKALDAITGAIHAIFEGDPVNVANGNLVHTETDFSIQSRGLPLLWKRVYNSKLNYDGPLGFGWVHFYDVHLTENADGSVLFLDDDGGKRPFTKNPDGSYTPPPGVYLTLTKLSDGFTLRDKSGLLYRFRSVGKLIRLEDPNGNASTLSYNGSQLAQVTDALGRSLSLAYNGQGKIERVQDFSGRAWTYAYDGEGNLTSAIDPLNQATGYEYYAGQFNPGNNHNMKKVTDREGHAVQFLYYTNDRVFRHVNDLGETRTFSYNIFWQETTVTNENGFTKTFRYDEQGNLVKLIEETGAIWRYTWDARHNRLSDIDPLGQTTTYTYDDRGNVLTVDDPLNPPVIHTYEPVFSKRTSTTDARGFRTQWAYDAKGNLRTVTDSLNEVASFAYDAFGNRTAQTDRRGVRTTFAYDGFDRLIERRTQLVTGDVVTTFEYDTLGRLTARVDPNAHRASWTYDALGRVLEAVQHLDPSTPVVTTFAYDKNGRTRSVSDAEGRVASFAYDAAGRRISVTDPLNQATTFRYDKLGNVVAITAANGTVTQFEYDGKGNLTKTLNPLQQASTLRYNLLDRVVASTDPNGNTTSFEYDALQRLIAVTDGLGNTTRFAYDPNGNRTRLTDAEGRVAQFVYDPVNRLSQVVDARGGVTGYDYDAVGNLIRITDANGHTTGQEFDGLNRMTTTVDPLGNRWRFAYDGAGNRISQTDPNGQTITFLYDALDRLIEKQGLSPQGTVPEVVATYAYDKVGNRTLAQNPAVSLAYQYDPLNRLTQAQDSRFGRSLTYAYDPVGNRASLTDAEGLTTRYQHDEADRLIRIEDPFGGHTQYAYDPAGRRTSRRSPNHVVSLYAYDAANRLTNLETKHLVTDNLIGRFSYTYDRLGNRLTMTEPSGEHRYTYDALDRLTDAAYPDGASETLTYDAVGNRLSQADPAGTTTYAYDAANRLLQEGTTVHTYDANGNLLRSTTGDQSHTYRYDAEQRLVAVEEDDTQVATYAYDAQGRRIEKAVGSGLGAQRTRYLYDGAQVLTETSATQALKARYVYGPGIDEPLLMVRNGAFSYLHPDGLGSVTAATDARGVLVESYRYRAFGEPTVLDPTGQPRATSAIGNPFLFTGREFDQETGLYYYRTRYYQQTIGRFLTPDPFPASPTNPQSLHRYSYVANNPINRLDPFGLRAEAAEIPDSRLERMRDSNRTGGGPPPPGGGGRDEDRRITGVHPDIAEFLERREFRRGPGETFTRGLERGEPVEFFGGLALTGRRQTEVTVAPLGNEVYQIEASTNRERLRDGSASPSGSPARLTATLGEHRTTISNASFEYDPSTRGVTILGADIPALDLYLAEKITGKKIAFPLGPFPLPEN
ncbi:MAG: hypothetical protein HYY90_05510 [Candidatus Omnitrophica bacterium]|nr:hypothetical protein [Candidatus Omnitrophota bacterium]